MPHQEGFAPGINKVYKITFPKSKYKWPLKRDVNTAAESAGGPDKLLDHADALGVRRGANDIPVPFR